MFRAQGRVLYEDDEAVAMAATDELAASIAAALEGNAGGAVSPWSITVPAGGVARRRGHPGLTVWAFVDDDEQTRFRRAPSAPGLRPLYVGERVPGGQ